MAYSVWQVQAVTPRIVAVGALYLDIVCDNFPFDGALWPERKVVGSGYRLLPGGSAVNFACTVASLDLPSSLVGKVGIDVPGRSLRTLVGDAGVDLRSVASANVQTNLGLNFNGVANGTILANVGSANQSMSADEVLPTVFELLDNATHLYLGGCMKLIDLLPALPDLASEARRRGVKVIVDHGRPYNTLTDDVRVLVRELCAEADYYLPSIDELIDLWNARSVTEAAETVKNHCDADLVVKDGENGVVAFTAEGRVEVPAYPVTVTNPVGAGDGFNAGFLRATVDGRSLRDCLDYGCATAALKISRTALPTMADVDKLRASRTLTD